METSYQTLAVSIDRLAATVDVGWVKDWPRYRDRIGVQETRTGEEQHDFSIGVDLAVPNQPTQARHGGGGLGRSEDALESRDLAHCFD
ncbi:MAG: hypothetical protein ACRDIY_14370, partial [Chloroflexota bacterium]